MLKVLGELGKQPKVAGRNHVDRPEYCAWKNAFFTNHSAELKGRWYTVRPNMALCEKLRCLLDIYSHHVASGLEDLPESSLTRLERLFLLRGFFYARTIGNCGILMSIRISPVRAMLTTMLQKPGSHLLTSSSWTSSEGKKSLFGKLKRGFTGRMALVDFQNSKFGLTIQV